jgi:hypothetical protein
METDYVALEDTSNDYSWKLYCLRQDLHAREPDGLNRRNLFFSWRLGIYGRDLGIQQIAQRPPPLTTWSVLSSGSVSC